MPRDLNDLGQARAELRRRSRSPLYRVKSRLLRWARSALGRPGPHLTGVDALSDRVWRLERQLDDPTAQTPTVPRPKPIPAAPSRRVRRAEASGERPRVAVISWSLSHNPAGRGLTLAEVLARSCDVELVGACFPAFGNGLWRPMRGTPVDIRSYPGELFPAHWRRLERLAPDISADVLYVSKPRFPSLALGALAKADTGRPLIVDVDDDEAALTGLAGPLSFATLSRHGDAPSSRDPTGALWTGVAASMVGAADQVTAANALLAEKHAALLVPHARDERVFDPALYDRIKERARLGLAPTDRVILFAGTPGRYKGIVKVAEAIRKIGDPRYKLCVIGSPMDRRLVRDVKRAGGRHVRWMGDRPLRELPANLSTADLVCVLQDARSQVARTQTPAKVTDALAMGVPVLGSATPPLVDLARRGLIQLVDDTPLAEQLRNLLERADDARAHAEANRQVFLREFSYAAVAPRLDHVVRSLLDAAPTYSPALDELTEYCRAKFSTP